ncbi:hypothetical protein KC336_g21651, partial [Hortaea werneckii]
GLALFTFGELANLNTHLILRGLRSAGGTERGVPKGLGFGWVTCPNYLFESIAWLGILLINRSWATAVFIAVAVGQMAIWAKKKENRYRKELGSKYQKKRYSMIPGIWSDLSGYAEKFSAETVAAPKKACQAISNYINLW